ncbi:MAG: GNAT family N-acetyltransferase, partial [Candidatus Puniceispirillum sp.]
MTLSIRPLAAADFDTWCGLWRAYLAFYETTVADEIYDVTFARLIAPDHPAQNAFVAVIDGTVAGLVHYIYHPHNWRREDVCYLQDLFIDPAYRGTGVGRALIEAVYRAADANDTPSVYWLTQD